MTPKATALILCLLPVTSVLAIGEARSEDLNSAIKACDAKAGCSHQPADAGGGMLFQIHSGGQTKNIRCTYDGNCMRILPRGKKYPVQGFGLMIAEE
jgi:hypothetical protein